MDYFFMTADGRMTREELPDFPRTTDGDAAMLAARRDGKIVKCLIVRDSHTKNVFGHVVPVKGLDEDQHVVQLVASDVR